MKERKNSPSNEGNSVAKGGMGGGGERGRGRLRQRERCIYTPSPAVSSCITIQIE